MRRCVQTARHSSKYVCISPPYTDTTYMRIFSISLLLWTFTVKIAANIDFGFNCGAVVRHNHDVFGKEPKSRPLGRQILGPVNSQIATQSYIICVMPDYSGNYCRAFVRTFPFRGKFSFRWDNITILLEAWHL